MKKIDKMDSEDIIDDNDLSIEQIKGLLGGTIDSLFDDDDIKASIEQSENIIKKNIDELMNQFSNFKVDINFINKSKNEDPKYSHKGDSGFDLRANLLEDTETLKPGEWKAIPTGLHFEIPEGYELQVRPRSGLSMNYGVTVLNSPGTVDSGYRGEIQVILINHSKNNFVIENGDRIAQGVISSVATNNTVNLYKKFTLSESERGDGKSGSTGVK